MTREHESASSPGKSKVRPRIANIKTIRKAVKKADVIYIGYPIWWGEAPHIWMKGRGFYDVPSQKTVNKWVKSIKY